MRHSCQYRAAVGRAQERPSSHSPHRDFATESREAIMAHEERLLPRSRSWCQIQSLPRGTEAEVGSQIRDHSEGLMGVRDCQLLRQRVANRQSKTLTHWPRWKAEVIRGTLNVHEVQTMKKSRKTRQKSYRKLVGLLGQHKVADGQERHS